MKRAFIDQIVLWIIGIVLFVVLLFFTIEYAQALRIKENLDRISNYGARMVALGKTNEEITTGLNQIRLGTFSQITSSDIVCVDGTAQNYQAIFTVKTTYNNRFLPNKADNVDSITVFFHEVSPTERTCTLQLQTN